MSKLAQAKRSLRRWQKRLAKSEAKVEIIRSKISESQRLARVAQRRITGVKKKLAKPGAPAALSEEGVRFIAQFEGWAEKPYNDPANHCTIGFGHLLHHGPCTASDAQEWGRISKEKGYELLRQDAAVAIKAIKQAVKVPLNQNEFDALVSFVFNVGSGAFASSTLLKKLNAGDRKAAADELLRWVYAGGKVLPGLQRRRQAERQLFLRASS